MLYCFCVVFDEYIFCLVVCIGLVEFLCLGCVSVVDYNYLYWLDMFFDILEIVFSEGEVLGMCIVLCWGGVIQGWVVEQDLLVVLCLEIFDGYMVDVEWLVSCYYDFWFEFLCWVVMVFIIVLYFVLGVQLWEMVKLVCQLGIWLYSYLLEIVDYFDVVWQKFVMMLVQFCVEYDWLGNDVWFVYLVKLLLEEIVLLGCIGIGIVYCL